MKTTIISLGGSIIVPDKVDVVFLKEFKKLVLDLIAKDERIVLVTGGGKTCRNYQNAANEISEIKKDDLDWVGIISSRLNGELIRSIFGKDAYEDVIYDPTQYIDTDKKIIVAAGWKPGFSTDTDAVLMAKNLNAEKVLNLTNVDYVYDKDPRKHEDAEPIKEISWVDFKKIVGGEWIPGLNLPFDPNASKLAEEAGIKVIIINGTDIDNLKDCLSGNEFKGTIIE